MATRDTMLDVLRLIMERIGNFEALMEARVDVLSGNVAALTSNVASMSDTVAIIANAVAAKPR